MKIGIKSLFTILLSCIKSVMYILENISNFSISIYSNHHIIPLKHDDNDVNNQG